MRFFDVYFLLAQMGIEETPSTWETLWKQLVTVLWVRIIFWEIWQKMTYDLPIVLRASGYPIGWSDFFFGFMFFEILKNLVTFFSDSCF